ncbi:MAG: response regulator transcription factor [Oscillospiraceae bacterium]|nr:response regulator transcription factor [Oscillospiraceae bacterium]MBQ3878901.1 response regulator transcription factor [Oscillospiraceae bacterium]
MKKILVIEDEDNIRSFVVINLKRAGYAVVEAASGEEAFEVLAQNPDVILMVVDLMLPGIDGYEICRRVRASGSNMGIVMLTARSQEMDKVTGLMTGADDYITKPFSPAELTARIDALMRRLGGSGAASDEIVSGPFSLSLKSRTVMKDGARIELTQVEYLIMKLFLENPNRALSREEILKTVWGQEYFGDLKIVDVNIRRLRLKIEANPASPQFIETVWGYGYKWDA